MLEWITNIFGGNTASEKADKEWYSLEETEAAALRVCKKDGAALIILSGGVENNYSSFLDSLGAKLYQRRLIDENWIFRMSLLPILSGDDSMKTVADRLTGAAEYRGRAYYVSGFHQMDYSKINVKQLLGAIQKRLQDGQLRATLVLNIPQIICPGIRASFPQLWSGAVRYVEPNCQLPKETEDEKNARSSVGSAQFQPEPNRRPAHEKTPQQPDHTPPKPALPWYMTNPSLLAQEKQGMADMARRYHMQSELATLPFSKRLYWKLQFRYRGEKGEFAVKLRLLYSNTFSESKPAVGLVIDDSYPGLWRAVAHSPRCITYITEDQEEQMLIYTIRPEYEYGNLTAATATLQGFLSILDTIETQLLR